MHLSLTEKLMECFPQEVRIDLLDVICKMLRGTTLFQIRQVEDRFGVGPTKDVALTLMKFVNEPFDPEVCQQTRNQVAPHCQFASELAEWLLFEMACAAERTLEGIEKSIALLFALLLQTLLDMEHNRFHSPVLGMKFAECASRSQVDVAKVIKILKESFGSLSP